MRWAAMLMAAGAVIAILPAQDTRGAILGRISDSTGAVVPGAVVRAVKASARPGGSTRADTNGEYILPFLEPGTYDLWIEAPGFRAFHRESIMVAAGGQVTVHATLEVGPANQTVEVVADTPLLDPAAGSFGLDLGAELIQAVPLRDGNPLGLALLAPGVVNVSEDGLARPFDNENVSAIAVSGSASGTHEFQFEGAVNTGGMGGAVAYVPPAGAVSEVRVDASPFDARNGFAAGAGINMVLRAGTNRPHGQLVAAIENPATNANSFFSNQTTLGKDNFRQTQWSAVAGGPLVVPRVYNGRNRTFWMYAYEGIRASQPYRRSNLAFTLPSAAERNGDFSDLLRLGKQYQIYDPATTQPADTAGRYTRMPFPGNIIPSSRLSQTAENLIARFYPLPDIAAASPAATNYILPSIQANRYESHTFRLDQTLGGRQKLFATGAWSDRSQETELRFNGAAGLDGSRGNRALGIGDAVTLGPRLLLTLRYNYVRYADAYTPPSAGIDLAGLGFSQTYAAQIRSVDARNVMLPDISPAGYPELNGYTMTRAASAIDAGSVDLARATSRHTLHFGGEYRIYADTSGNTGRSAGSLNFSSNWTRGPLDNSAAAPIGQGLASFLLGLPTGGSMDINPSLAQRYGISGWYAQDTWRVASRFTVTLGLRWEHESPVVERYDRSIRGFDFDAPSPIAAAVQSAYAKSPVPQIPAAAFAVRGGLRFAGLYGQPRELWRSSNRNYAPRVGFAWMPGAGTVVRGGYGLFYDLARQMANQTGFSRSTTLVASQDTGQTYIASLENPFPNGFAMPVGSSLGLMTNAGQNVSFFPERLLNPYVQRWQVTVERRLGSQALLAVGYVGNRATHLRLVRQLDGIPLQYLSNLPVRDNALYAALTANVKNPFYPLLPGTGLAGTTVQLQQLLRPFPQFAGVAMATNGGYSWYHALQAQFQKRFRTNWLFMAGYTWSKFMDATAFLNESDPLPARAISAQDRPQRFAAAGVYELPLARGRRWLGGWQLQGIYQKQSGAPLGFGNAIYYGGDIHAIALPADRRTPARWFDTTGFERNPAAQLVYNARTFPLRFAGIRSMGIDMWDLGASKIARIAERARLEARADFFNALNHAHFAAPLTVPTSPDFGSVTATSQLPRVIQFSTRVQF